ncbi:MULTISPECIES: hypothetical protein [Shewanella]|uniref:Uncharacterized protein n=1 Tax=Shewanella psychromarinicola TaxID=2487742 RepID=A0A3N4DS84_9GAMM|nr:hypothetical protein [Shewanella psychromarinicola]AZG35634.1 hypothetical protein EGC80_12500 [Shewanella psychromarinicola]MCL1081336.1 hypothetical protein [Shewanella psychromarinicola]RPA27617.1 hypothetical protein EGC77_16580 [Shewanella psychromarinicola]
MENILQFQTALGSLVDIVPEPKKVKRKTHSIKLSYDLNNSNVSSAWADSIYEISKSFDRLVDDEARQAKKNVFKSYFKSYEHTIDLGDKISLNELIDAINEFDAHSNQLRLKNSRKVETKK